MSCHFLLQGIFPTQGWNLDLLHYRQMLYCLSHQESWWPRGQSWCTEYILVHGTYPRVRGRVPTASLPTLSLRVSLCACLSPCLSISAIVSLRLSPRLSPLPSVFLSLPPPVSLSSLSSSHSMSVSLSISPLPPLPVSSPPSLCRSVYVCLSLPPSFSLYHHLSPNVSGGVQDLIWTVESAFRQNIFSPVLLPIMSKDILPNGSHINTTPLCTSPELNECYVTDVPQTRTQSAKTQPIALARGPVSK